jgi:hypothetical protein
MWPGAQANAERCTQATSEDSFTGKSVSSPTRMVNISYARWYCVGGPDKVHPIKAFLA